MASLYIDIEFVVKENQLAELLVKQFLGFSVYVDHHRHQQLSIIPSPFSI